MSEEVATESSETTGVVEGEMPIDNMRCRLSAKPGGKDRVYGPYTIENPMYRLHITDGLIFPYTPSVSYGTTVSYEEYHSTHAVYKYNAFQRSAPQEITIVADFTAHSIAEAEYLLAVTHFLKVVSKAYFGVKAGALAGTPPPVLLFNYLGQYMFKDVPVIIKSFVYTLPPDVDYVTIYSNDHSQQTYVPTHMSIQLVLDTQYNTLKIREEFDLAAFTSGKLLNKGFI